jgi:hypothetical protein
LSPVGLGIRDLRPCFFSIEVECLNFLSFGSMRSLSPIRLLCGDPLCFDGTSTLWSPFLVLQECMHVTAAKATGRLYTTKHRSFLQRDRWCESSHVESYETNRAAGRAPQQAPLNVQARPRREENQSRPNASSSQCRPHARVFTGRMYRCPQQLRLVI